MAINYAKEHNITTIVLAASSDGHKLYEKCGFNTLCDMSIYRQSK